MRARLTASALLHVAGQPIGVDPVVSGHELAEHIRWKVRTEAQREQQRGADLFVAGWLSNPVGERRASEGSRSYIRHIGFNLVALFDGFVVVSAFNGGVPGWVAAVIGAGVAVAGHLAIGELERRHAASSAPMMAGTA
jgi:hypothetical protein